MRFPFLSHLSSHGGTGATRYFCLQSFYTSSHATAEADAAWRAPIDGRLSGFSVFLVTAPGAGNTVTYTVMKNGSATALECVVTDTNVTVTDLGDYVDFSAGDTLSIKVVSSASAVASATRVSLECEAASQLIFAGNPNVNASTGATDYYPLQSGAKQTTSTDFGSIIPTSGRLEKWRSAITTAAGTAKSWTITPVVNGVDQDGTGGTQDCTMVLTGTSQLTDDEDTGYVDVVAGDRVYWKVVPSGTPAGTKVRMSCVFSPTTEGQSILTYSSNTINNVLAGNNFLGVGGGGAGSWGAEASRLGIAPGPYTIQALYAHVNAAPGSGNSFIFGTRASGASSANVTIADSATDGNATGLAIQVNPNANLGFRTAAATGTPTATPVSVSMLLSQGPALPHNDPFTASNGTVPDAAKWFSDLIGGATNTTQSNAMRMRTAASGTSVARLTSKHEPALDVELLFSFKKSQITEARTSRIYARANGIWGDYTTSITPDIGIGLQIVDNTNAIAVVKNGGSGFAGFDTSVTYPPTNDTNKHWCRMRLVGDQFKVRFWADGAGEPTTWDRETTMSWTDYDRAGVEMIAVTRGSATAIADLIIDDWNVDEVTLIYPALVQATTTIGAPSVSNTTFVTPALVQATTTIGAPTVSGGATVSPALVQATTTIGAPGLPLGTTVTPALVQATTTIGAVTVAAAMRFPMFGNLGAVAAGDRYSGPHASVGTSATSSVGNATVPMPAPLTIHRFTIELDGAAGGGAGIGYRFTLYKNGSATGLTFDVTNTATTGAIETDVSWAIDDTLTVFMSPLNAPASNRQVALGIDAESPAGQILISVSNGSTLTNSAVRYMGLQGSVIHTSAPQSVITADGKIKSLKAKLSAAPGAAKSYDVELYVNGSATGLKATFSGAAQVLAEDMSHEITVAKGDTAYWVITPTGTPSSPTIQIAAVFAPTVAGESIHTNVQSNSGNATNRYNTPDGSPSGDTGIEASARAKVPQDGYTAKTLYLKQSAVSHATDATKKRTATFRQATADTALTVEVAGNVSVNTDTTHTISLTKDAVISLKRVETNTPDAAAIAMGLVITAAVQGSTEVTPALVQATTTIGAPGVSVGQTVPAALVQATTTIGAVTVTAVVTVSPALVQATTTIGAPSVKTGETVSPALVQATTTIGAVSVSTGTRITAVIVQAVTTIGAPSITAVTRVSPALVQAVTTIGAVTVTAVTTVSPALVQATTTIGAPSVSVGVTVSPALVQAVTTIGAVSVSTGTRVSPALVQATTTIGAVTVLAVTTVTPALVQATTIIGAPGVSVGVTVSPALVQAVTTIAAPSVSTGIRVSPVLVQATTTIGAVAVTAVTRVSPALVQAVTTIGAVTVGAGVGITPALVQAVTVIGAPSIAVGVTVSPALVQAVTVIGAPGVSTGTRVTPALVQAVTTIGAVTVTAVVTVTPALVQAVTTIGAPGVKTGETVSPALVQAVTTIGTPSVAVGETASPALVQATTTIGSVSVTAVTRVTPALVQATTTIGAVTITAVTRVSPALVQAVTTIGAPSVSTGQTVSPAIVTATTTIGTPTVVAGAAVTPAIVTATTTIGSVSVTAVTTVSPALVQATTTIGAPSVRTGETVSPALVQAVTTIGAPSISVGVTTAPALVQATTTIGTPTVGTGLAISPALVTATTTIGAVTVTAVVRVTPALVQAVTTIGAPSVSVGETVSPALVQATTTIGAVTVATGAKVTPALVQATTTIGAPAVSVGVRISPALVQATTTIGAPTVQTGAGLTPALVQAVTTIGSPSVGAGATTTPALVQATTTIGSPTIAAGALVSTAIVQATTTIGAPTVATGLAISPALVQATTTIGAVSLATGETVTPALVQATTTIGAPSVHAGTQITVPVVLAVTTIGAPSISTGARPTPVLIQALVTIGAPSLTTGIVISPALVEAVVTIGSPVVAGGARPTPSTVQAFTTIGALGLSAGSLVTPVVVQATTWIGLATVSALGSNAGPPLFVVVPAGTIIALRGLDKVHAVVPDERVVKMRGLDEMGIGAPDDEKVVLT